MASLQFQQATPSPRGLKWQLTYWLTTCHIIMSSHDFGVAPVPTSSLPLSPFPRKMHLVFSTSDFMNSDISDSQGRVVYSISTPRATKRITTIIKYRWSGPNNVSETMATIEWHALKNTLIRFNGNEITADAMLPKRRWNTGRYFVGPDKRCYKWKLESTHCWMKLAESNVALAKFHKKNFGIRKQSHPPYLDVSPTVISMLDHIILTYVYVESLRRERLGHLSEAKNT